MNKSFVSGDFHFRIGYLYGKVLPNKSVKVEVIYEPPQDCTEFYFNILEDPKMVRHLNFFNYFL